MTEDAPTRPLKTFESPFHTLVPRRAYGGAIEALFQVRHFPDPRAEFALDLMARWGAVAAEPGGEDSAGRQRWKAMEPEDVVGRAVDIAERAFAAFVERGWLIPMPSLEEQVDAAKENAGRN